MIGLMRKNLYMVKNVLITITILAAVILLFGFLIAQSMKTGNLHKYGYTIENMGDGLYDMLSFLLNYLIICILIAVSVISGNQPLKWKQSVYSMPINPVRYVMSYYSSYSVLVIGTILLELLMQLLFSKLFRPDVELLDKSVLWSMSGSVLLMVGITWLIICLFVPCSMLIRKYATIIGWGIIFVTLMLIAIFGSKIVSEDQVVAFLSNTKLVWSSSITFVVICTVISMAGSIAIEKRRRYL